VTEYAGVKFNPIIELGDRVKFSNGVHITAINQIIIGNDVLFGSHVYISDHNHGGYSGDLHTPPTVPPADRVLHSNGKVVIEANVWIGDNVNIVGPVTIGYGAVIAANSVVRKDVPSNTIVAGAPARLLKMFNASNQEWERNL
jgi:lipopolysaccharide O-acetyltransferase